MRFPATLAAESNFSHHAHEQNNIHGGGVLLAALLTQPAIAQTTTSYDHHVTHDLTVDNWSFLHERSIYLNGNNASWTVENAGGTLCFYPYYNWQGPTVRFLSTGDVSLPGRVSIGDVACSPACPGALGINNLTLAVGGKIGAQGGVYVVNYQGAWPDYVFRPDYSLPPLADVARYIEANQHLPEVPSATQVANEGLELAAMNATLLKKVEELTLYLLRLETANQALTERVTKLEATH